MSSSSAAILNYEKHTFIQPLEKKPRPGRHELLFTHTTYEMFISDLNKMKGRAGKGNGKRIRSGRAERAMFVDLTRGWASYLPASTPEACWTLKPKSTCRRCNMQGVMRLRQPRWARVLSIHLVFDSPKKYTINIADSSTNNGWGKNYLSRGHHF